VKSSVSCFCLPPEQQFEKVFPENLRAGFEKDAVEMPGGIDLHSLSAL
jgi:hypothetical protein